MKTMYLDISIPRFLITRLLGRVSQAAYFAPTSPLFLAELDERPLPSPTWIRVRNQMCGICGSDLHQLFIDAGLDIAPIALPSHKRIYLGHEMVGEVIEVGTAVTDFKVGDRVVRWGRADDCLARERTELCPACTRGHRVLCEIASEPKEHNPVGGGFGDTFITPQSSLLPVLDGLTDEQAIFVEPTAVAIHAAWRRPARVGEKVLVLGVGTIGFLLIQTIRALQPDCEITALAQFPWQAEIARDLGADGVFLVSDDGYTAVAERTGAKLYTGRGNNQMLLGGFDVVFDVVGIQPTLNNSLRWTRAGGTVVVVGVNFHRMTLDISPIWYQEVDLIGAIGHDVVTWEDKTVSTFTLAMQWMLAGKVKTDILLTHRFGLDAYRKAFATAVDKKNHRSIKVAFDL
ncbi:MAG: alcohol dehydrogenase catalytic domain-containing protein [Chloroflexi bacterium]|nr:alcohol dehydrogenase catalytic domain-containing protein [Chloroflexota bacterium]